MIEIMTENHHDLDGAPGWDLVLSLSWALRHHGRQVF